MTTWHTVTLTDLDDGHPVRQIIEDTIESWMPNHLTDTGRLRDTNGLIERCEGVDLPDGTRLDLGPETDSPEWRKMVRLARRIASEST